MSYHEPLRVTLLRTGLLALVVGFAAALLQRQPASWWQWTAFALWFTFGGHWVEIFFLNWLGLRLAAARAVQVTARLLTWLGGGTLLMIGARFTTLSLSAHALRLPPWWMGGPGLVCIELLIHVLPHLRRQPSFYNGLQ